MTHDTCKVAECDRPRKTRGWCKSHYMFWYQNRVEPTGPVRVWGVSRTEVCSVAGCDKPYAAVGYCAPHYKRFTKYGSPGSVEIRPRSVGEDADYALAHRRVAKARGRAAEQQCVRCDGPARQWAYDHMDPAEKVDPRGYAYSIDPMHYLPMCISCHKQFDMARVIEARYQTTLSDPSSTPPRPASSAPRRMEQAWPCKTSPCHSLTRSPGVPAPPATPSPV